MEIIKLERTEKKVIGKHPQAQDSMVCGIGNPASLKTTFYLLEGGEIACVFKGDKYHIGHQGLLHGGITAMILDEAMGRAPIRFEDGINSKVEYVVTGTYTVKYLIPIKLNEEMKCIGREMKVEGRKHFCEAYIINKNNEIMAKAEGIYIRIEGKDDSDRLALDSSSIELNENDPLYL